MYSGVRFMKIDVNASTHPFFLYDFCLFSFWSRELDDKHLFLHTSPHFKLSKYYPPPNLNIIIKKKYSKLLNTVKIDRDFCNFVSHNPKDITFTKKTASLL